MPGLHADTAAMNTNGRDTVANAEYLEQELSSLEAAFTKMVDIAIEAHGMKMTPEEKVGQLFFQLT